MLSLPPIHQVELASVPLGHCQPELLDSGYSARCAATCLLETCIAGCCSWTSSDEASRSDKASRTGAAATGGATGGATGADTGGDADADGAGDVEAGGASPPPAMAAASTPEDGAARARRRVMASASWLS